MGLLEDRCDLTLDDVQRRLLSDHGMSAGIGTIWRFYNRHDISFKKSLFASEQKRGDVALARWLWKRNQKQIDPERLVFIDEMGAATDMVPATAGVREASA